MIDFFRRVFRRPDAQSPDITAFVARQRASRAEAIDDRRNSERVTRQLRRETASTIAGMARDVERHWGRTEGRGDVG